MRDPRTYPSGRGRVYLDPAHMDLHAGGHGFFIERMDSQDFLGYYDPKIGETARAVSPAFAKIFKVFAQESLERHGLFCGNGSCENALRAYIHAMERAKNYVPDDLDQRPPLEVVEGRIHRMLDSAMIHGFATGSVGAIFHEQDDHFTYEVTYTIKRKRRKGTHVRGLGVIKS